MGNRGPQQAPPYLAEFALDQNAAEFTPDASEGHSAVLQAFAGQCCLVKAVKNYEWIELMRRLKGPSFRTATSLPPPGGKNMRLFGQASMGSVGLIWDRRQLDLSNAFMWPCGYFAKSDFNIGADGKLLNGREKALVTLEDLIHANSTLTYENSGSVVTGGVMPFNEVMAEVSGTDGLVGIFSRSARVKHLLLAMGVRALVSRALPGAGELPLFVHDPDLGMRAFGRAAMSKLLSEYMVFGWWPADAQDGPSLPFDTHKLELHPHHQLKVHGAHGVTADALSAIVDSTLKGIGEDIGSPCGRDTRGQAVHAILMLGLHAAVEADNAASALSLVRHVAPLLCKPPDQEDKASMEPALHADTIAVSLPGSGDADLSGCLHKLAARAKSQSMLMTVGATIAFHEFVSGRMVSRIDETRKKLAGWLRSANSIIFRLRSWRELQAHRVCSRGPRVTSFMTQKAIANRSEFHDALGEIKECSDPLGVMTKLNDLISRLHQPCLRLEMLQHILGLDANYDLKAVMGVVSLAQRILQDVMQQGQENEEKPAVLPRSKSFRDRQFETAALRMQGLNFDKSNAQPDNKALLCLI